MKLRCGCNLHSFKPNKHPQEMLKLQFPSIFTQLHGVNATSLGAHMQHWTEVKKIQISQKIIIFIMWMNQRLPFHHVNIVKHCCLNYMEREKASSRMLDSELGSICELIPYEFRTIQCYRFPQKHSLYGICCRLRQFCEQHHHHHWFPRRKWKKETPKIRRIFIWIKFISNLAWIECWVGKVGNFCCL